MSYVNVKEKSELVKLTKELQKRFQLEKQGEREDYDERRKMFQPITDTLNKRQPLQLMPMPVDNFPSEPQKAIEAPSAEELKVTNLDLLATKYLKKLAVARAYDSSYGLKLVDDEGANMLFLIGKTPVNIQGDGFLRIGHTTYPATEGLWKLLTLKEPGYDFLPGDYNNYKTIMLRTKAFLNEDGSVKSNRGRKYMEIIKPIYEEYKLTNPQVGVKPPAADARMPPTRERSQRRKGPQSTPTSPTRKTGEGIRYLSSDPNELVRRHRILLGEMTAGNTSVYNEFHAVHDELIRRNILS